jgi:DNA-binding beta-propeller fold protein YncE
MLRSSASGEGKTTRAGLPIKEMLYVDELPPPNSPAVLNTAIGTLETSTKTVSAIPAETSVSDFLAAVTVTRGAAKKIINSGGYDVTSGTVQNGQILRVFVPTDIEARTDYTLSTING